MVAFPFFWRDLALELIPRRWYKGPPLPLCVLSLVKFVAAFAQQVADKETSRFAYPLYTPLQRVQFHELRQ